LFGKDLGHHVVKFNGVDFHGLMKSAVSYCNSYHGIEPCGVYTVCPICHVQMLALILSQRVLLLLFSGLGAQPGNPCSLHSTDVKEDTEIGLKDGYKCMKDPAMRVDLRLILLFETEDNLNW